MVNKVYACPTCIKESWSIRYFICPICTKDSLGQLGLVYVLLVLRKVMVNRVIYLSYLYKGLSLLIRSFYILLVLKTVMDNKVLYMSYLY